MLNKGNDENDRSTQLSTEAKEDSCSHDPTSISTSGTTVTELPQSDSQEEMPNQIPRKRSSSLFSLGSEGVPIATRGVSSSGASKPTTTSGKGGEEDTSSEEGSQGRDGVPFAGYPLD